MMHSALMDLGMESLQWIVLALKTSVLAHHPMGGNVIRDPIVARGCHYD